ncbi:hypothetical protein Ga0466249_005424, partial [Sporomusaceae bacterium BoRhaA]|nr:hypothetical protein [Pelorhabdus rhamnosifermentans]
MFNDHFSVQPEALESAFRPLSTSLNIDAILCVKLTRSVDAGGVFSFYNRHFKVITSPELPLLPAKAKVAVLVGPRMGVAVEFKKTLFSVLP